MKFSDLAIHERIAILDIASKVRDTQYGYNSATGRYAPPYVSTIAAADAIAAWIIDGKKASDTPCPEIINKIKQLVA